MDEEQCHILRKELLQLWIQKIGFQTDEAQNYDSGLESVLEMLKELLVVSEVHNGEKHEIKLANCYFVRPYENGVGLDTPLKALLHGSYDALIKGDFLYSKYGEGGQLLFQNKITGYTICEFPVMLGSVLDHQSTGLTSAQIYHKRYLKSSCFISNMHVRIFPAEEFIVNNRILHRPANGSEVRSTFFFGERRYRTNSTLQIGWKLKNNKGIKWWREYPRLEIKVPYENPPIFISLMVVVMGLGYIVEEFVEWIARFRRVPASTKTLSLQQVVLSDVCGCQNSYDALLLIAKLFKRTHKINLDQDKAESAKEILRREILPHLTHYSQSTNEAVLLWERRRKMVMFAMIVADIFDRMDGKSSNVNSRSYKFIRFKTPIQFMLELMRKNVKNACTVAKAKLQHMLNNKLPILLHYMLQPSMFELTTAIKNGNFNPSGRKNTKSSTHNTGKTDVITLGYCSDSYPEQTGKIIKKPTQQCHDLKANVSDPSQVGYVCMYMTPQSKHCGVFRHKAMGARFSPNVNMIKLQQQLERLVGEWIVDDYVHGACVMYDVFGGFMGWILNPREFCGYLIEKRRQGLWYRHGNIEYIEEENQIWCNVGGDRLVRPLIVASAWPKLCHGLDRYRLQFSLLQQEGIIEWLDPNEEQCGLVKVAATFEEIMDPLGGYTHIEIHVSLVLAVNMTRAFFNYNSGPRELYTGLMNTKALSTKLPDIGATKSHMVYGQQFPLMSDPVTEALGNRAREPNGTNVTIAIMPAHGNMEDSVEFSQGCVDLGMFMSVQHNMELVVRNEECEIRKPDARCELKSSEHAYRHLDDNGIVKIGSQLEVGDAIVGMVNMKKRKRLRCVSQFLTSGTGGRVTDIKTYMDDKKKIKIVHVTYVSAHNPTVGDKFFIGHGQKFTVARMVRREDMPFNPMTGMSPDLLFNPHSLTRSTMGMLLDILFSKGRTLEPELIDAFDTVMLHPELHKKKLRKVEEVLLRHGFSISGTEMMCNGKTGEMMECPILMGPVYVHVLNHIAKQKCRHRDTGPMADGTHDPQLGMRHGAMEGWNLLSQGCTEVFKSTNREEGDKFQDFFWCEKHEMPANGSIALKVFHCQACGNADHVVRLQLPYKFILIMQETFAAHMGHSLHIKPGDVPFVHDPTLNFWNQS
jgi:DNA-directed RNA polymerase subunit B'